MVDIVVIGSLNMDLVIQAPRMPVAGETIAGQDLQMIPGGKGANQAAAASRLGGEVSMVGRVGEDAFGPTLIENLIRQGVDTRRIKTDSEASTGTALIIVDGSGENSIVISAGANGRVSPADVDDVEELLSQAESLLLQFEVPLDTVEHAIALAAHHPVRVILNPAPALKLDRGILSQVDVLVPNEIEVSALTGMDIGDPASVEGRASVEAAAQKLRDWGVATVIVTLGRAGALLVDDEGALHVPERRVEAVDTTAAGDAFIGGLAVALQRGVSITEAVNYATCAGALAVTQFGAQTSLPSKEDVDAFYEEGAPDGA